VLKFAPDFRFFCWSFFIRRLKGNTGVESGAVPATVTHKKICWQHATVNDQIIFGKAPVNVESQETCLNILILSKLSGERLMM
jgi:hypothetical protein